MYYGTRVLNPGFYMRTSIKINIEIIAKEEIYPVTRELGTWKCTCACIAEIQVVNSDIYSNDSFPNNFGHKSRLYMQS